MDYLRSLLVTLRTLLVASAASGALSSSGQTQETDPEAQLWAEALEEGTPDAFQNYLDTYPFGPHAQEAFEAMIVTALGSRSIEDIEPADGGPRVDVTPLGDLY
ncbi:hypothetical protein SH611_14000 [Geminicoccaceae bacterium 1502E]|nr:hypothetical protein [Geminicoccaceae bacterium 1502E]